MEAEVIEMLCRRYPAYTPETARLADASVLKHVNLIDLAYPPKGGD